MNWISALAELQRSGEPCVLVTIIEERGSTPRNAGSKMVVSAERLYDTIGGGHLEYRAQAIAREMLAARTQDTRLERFSLGASLGQCCGGATVLLFEPMGQPQAHIAVFGAGHVGRALVPLLASLPCRVRWIDSREHEFPALLPDGVEKVVNDEVLDEVERMPPGSHFIVMTHNHPLDLELTAAILARNDFAYFGLIGSKTKRVKFEHRLRERGVDAERLQRMRCPMGLEQVKGKLPAEIAISIAGEVIATYNAAFGLERKQGPSSVTRLTPSRAAPTNPERPRSPRPPPGGGPPTNLFRDCHDPQRQSLPRRHPAQHRRPRGGRRRTLLRILRGRPVAGGGRQGRSPR